jgi:NADPH-dependent ferric siderophore reductase
MIPEPSTEPPPGFGFTDRFMNRGVVTEVDSITPRMRLIRISSPAISDMEWTPGQQVRVMTGNPVSWKALRRGFRDLLRTYSVFDLDQQKMTIELCVLDHGDGPGARWARGLATGDKVNFGDPEGKFVLRSAPYHLFVGEETASVAFGAMLRAVAPEESVHGMIEVSNPDDRLELNRGDELTWQYRGDEPAAGSSTLISAVRSMDLPETPGFAYLAGESKVCAAVRRHLVKERAWPARQSIIVKPFWTPGKTGLE